MTESEADTRGIQQLREAERDRAEQTKRLHFFWWSGAIMLGAALGFLIAAQMIGERTVGPWDLASFLSVWSLFAAMMGLALWIIGIYFRWTMR